jgi:hypothetical protein
LRTIFRQFTGCKVSVERGVAVWDEFNHETQVISASGATKFVKEMKQIFRNIRGIRTLVEFLCFCLEDRLLFCSSPLAYIK